MHVQNVCCFISNKMSTTALAVAAEAHTRTSTHNYTESFDDISSHRSAVGIVGLLLVACSITMSLLSSYHEFWIFLPTDDSFTRKVKKYVRLVPSAINYLGAFMFAMSAKYWQM